MFSINLVGTQIADYFLEARIGRGGMASVYRARQLSAWRQVALKVISFDTTPTESEEFARRFEQEARLVAWLEHLHILPIYDYSMITDQTSGTMDGAYLAMRYVSGGSLEDRLSKGALPLPLALPLYLQAAYGLGFAHENGVIHRDIKPSNVLVDDAGNAFISDFGLAQITSEALNITQSGAMIGTPTYVAPELVQGQPATVRSDIYSMGVLLYHLLTGRPPFDEPEGTGSILTLLYQHVEMPPLPPRVLNPSIPTALEAVILRALSKHPVDRYADGYTLARAVEAAMEARVPIRPAENNHKIPQVQPMPSGLPFQGAVDADSSSRHRTAELPAASTTAPNPSRQFASNFWVGAALVLSIVLVIMILLIAELPRSRPFEILSGQTGTVDSVPLDSWTIVRARYALGDGFIAFIACSTDSLLEITWARQVTDLAAEDGMIVRVYDSLDDPYEQIIQIERARIEGTTGIILCPLLSDALPAAIDSLQEARIPLVFLTLIEHPYGVKLDAQNDILGIRLGEYAAALLNEEYGGVGSVAIFNVPTYEAMALRTTNIEATLHNLAPDAAILPLIGYLETETSRAISDLLEGGTTPDLIITLSDVGAYGVISSLEAAGIEPDEVEIISVGGEAQAERYIRDGVYMRATSEINLPARALLAYRGMVTMLAGGTLPEFLCYPPGNLLTRETLTPS
jgi:serine/threonine protein kinase/ABC-type sugar transport system substrate-binding protein